MNLFSLTGESVWTHVVQVPFSHTGVVSLSLFGPFHRVSRGTTGTPDRPPGFWCRSELTGNMGLCRLVWSGGPCGDRTIVV